MDWRACRAPSAMLIIVSSQSVSCLPSGCSPDQKCGSHNLLVTRLLTSFPVLLIMSDHLMQTYKWDRLRHWQAEVEADKQTSEVKDAASTEPSHQSGGKCGWFRCSSCWASTPKSEEKNIYDRGIWKNFVEVFNPRGFKRSVKNVNRKKQ